MSDIKIVDAAIASRRSLRAFLPTPVPRSEIEEILQVSARAPSGTNMQPWKVYVTMGETKQRLSDAVLAAHNDPSFKREQTYKYYPTPLFEPYLSRRRAVGWGLYSLLGIEKGEKEKMHNQHGRNYTFFDAPVGLMFTIDERLEIGFNAKYLLEIASQVDRENAVFLFNSSGDPTLMREGNDQSAVYVVMPMRV